MVTAADKAYSKASRRAGGSRESLLDDVVGIEERFIVAMRCRMKKEK